MMGQTEIAVGAGTLIFTLTCHDVREIRSDTKMKKMKNENFGEILETFFVLFLNRKFCSKTERKKFLEFFPF